MGTASLPPHPLQPAANTYLYFNDVSGLSSAASSRARVLVAGSIIDAIAYFLLLAVLGWHDEDASLTAGEGGRRGYDAEGAAGSGAGGGRWGRVVRGGRALGCHTSRFLCASQCVHHKVTRSSTRPPVHPPLQQRVRGSRRRRAAAAGRLGASTSGACSMAAKRARAGCRRQRLPPPRTKQRRLLAHLAAHASPQRIRLRPQSPAPHHPLRILLHQPLGARPRQCP